MARREPHPLTDCYRPVDRGRHAQSALARLYMDVWTGARLAGKRQAVGPGTGPGPPASDNGESLAHAGSAG